MEGADNNGLFANLTKLKTAILPNNFTQIGKGAFFGCLVLENVLIKNAESSTSNLFSKDNTKITVLHSSAFKNCPTLRITELPSSVNNMGANVFEGCSLLNISEIPGFTNIKLQDSFFRGCAISDFTFPTSVTTIGKTVFYITGGSLYRIFTIKNTVLTLPTATLDQKNVFGDAASIAKTTIKILKKNEANFSTWTTLGLKIETLKHNIAVNIIGNGTVNVTGVGSVSMQGDVSNGTQVAAYEGEDITFNAAPNLGFHFVNWTENGIEQSVSAAYTFSTTAGRTLVANFASNTLSVAGTTNVDDLSLSNCTSCDIIISSGALTVNTPKTFNSIIIEPGAKLNLSNNILSVTDLIIKANKTTSASVSVTSAMLISGTVRLLKTLDNTKWYFMSFPSDVAVNEITQVGGTDLIFGTNWWIKYYDGGSRIQNLGAESNWKTMTAGQTLEANKGYIIGLDNTLTGVGDYVLSFPLNKNLLQTAELAKTVSVLAYGEGLTDNKNTFGNIVAENHKGWNLVGVPYLSNFAGSGIGAAYLTLRKADGSTYEQKANTAVGRDINPFEAFFIQASTAGTGTDLSFALANRQLARSMVTDDLSDRVQLNLSNATGTDNTNLIMDNDQSTTYEINQDLEKWLSIGTDIPQIYTLLNGIKYAFNALPINSVHNLPVGIYTKTNGSATISLNATNAPGLSSLLLKDNTTGNSTDLMISDYNFTASAGTDNTRFVITVQSVTTQNTVETEKSGPTLRSMNGNLWINDLSVKSNVRVYDTTGRLIANEIAITDSLEIPLSLTGIYIIQIESGSKIWIRKYVK